MGICKLETQGRTTRIPTSVNLDRVSARQERRYTRAKGHEIPLISEGCFMEQQMHLWHVGYTRMSER